MNITVFLGSSEGSDPAIRRALEAMGAWIGDAGHTLIYGGSRVGLMGVLAETVKAHGGRVIGIEPRFFVEACRQYDGADELIVTEDMAERKQKLIGMADAVIAFPGGTGTLEELTQTLSMLTLDHVALRCAVYNVAGYYDPLKAQLDGMVRAGFYRADKRAQIAFPEDLDALKAAVEGGV